ncbi:MAG: hypothetical protein IKM88_04775, partial [Lachnospiraceae bacterium]|nr:hypothetical protein [Lachnospiraceae bacterium]
MIEVVRLMKMQRWAGILLILMIAAVICFSAAEGKGTLDLPAVTETDCAWNDQGNLVRETTHDLNGDPALNNRGFHYAEYKWDQHSNLIMEAYYGLSGEPVVIDKGYARAEYTYFTDRNKESHVLTEDRYAADGSRAEIPGEYSYRRDTWKDNNLVSSEYFNASGE